MSHDSLKQLYSYSLQLNPISIRFFAAPQGTYALQLHKGMQLLTKLDERAICNAQKCTYIFKTPISHSPTNTCTSNLQKIEFKLISTRSGYQWTIYSVCENILTHFESIPIDITPQIDRYLAEMTKHFSTICDLHQERARGESISGKWIKFSTNFNHKKINMEAVGVKCSVSFTAQFRDQLDVLSDDEPEDQSITATKCIKKKVLKTVSLDDAIANKELVVQNEQNKTPFDDLLQIDDQSAFSEISGKFDTILSEIRQMSNDSSVRRTKQDLLTDIDKNIDFSINKAILLGKDRTISQSSPLQKVKEELQEREEPKDFIKRQSENSRDSQVTITFQNESQQEQNYNQQAILLKQTQELRNKRVIMLVMVLAIIASLIYAFRITTDPYQIDEIRRPRNFK